MNQAQQQELIAAFAAFVKNSNKQEETEDSGAYLVGTSLGFSLCECRTTEAGWTESFTTVFRSGNLSMVEGLAGFLHDFFARNVYGSFEVDAHGFVRKPLNKQTVLEEAA